MIWKIKHNNTQILAQNRAILHQNVVNRIENTNYAYVLPENNHQLILITPQKPQQPIPKRNCYQQPIATKICDDESNNQQMCNTPDNLQQPTSTQNCDDKCFDQNMGNIAENTQQLATAQNCDDKSNDQQRGNTPDNHQKIITTPHCKDEINQTTEQN